MSSFPPHLQALLHPDAYPHAVGAVELVETHVSWVLLTGELAYKIKRPVHYAFVDLRSPKRRALLCREEVRLNRRFAPDLYLDVCPVSSLDGMANFAGRGPVIEQAVRMRQFARGAELDRLLMADAIEPAELESFGRDLARIHAELPVARPDQHPGRSVALRSRVMADAGECARAAQSLGADPSLVRGIEVRLAVLLEPALPLLARRLTAGRVRECHGDLHARNIVRLDGRLQAFDCLEFDPALRWIDVAEEIAFLLADLEARQRPRHAQAFLAGYLAESGDFEACELLPLFRADRALIRAKVTALAASPGGTEQDTRREFDAYVECARRCLARPAPVLVLMCGLSGSGKTWLAQRLAPQLLAVHVRSDVERKRLAGRAAADRTGSGVEAGLYSREATAKVYRHLVRCAAHTLAGGYTTIVDATLARREDRLEFASLAARCGVRSCIVHCRAPRQVLEARIRERLRHNDDASEADLAVLAWQEQRFEPPGPGEAGTVLEAQSAAAGVVETLAQDIRTLCA
jgi:uncharacterized protein